MCLGLITLDEMRAKQEDVIQQRERQMATSENASLTIAEKREKNKKKKRELQVYMVDLINPNVLNQTVIMVAKLGQL